MFFSLEMRSGYLHVFYDFGFSNGPVHLEDTSKKAQINDAKYHEVYINHCDLCGVFCFVSLVLRTIDRIRWSNDIGGKIIKLSTFTSKNQQQDPLTQLQNDICFKKMNVLSY